MTLVTVVVPSWNTRERLLACLTALEASRAVELDVVVVDNASADGSADMVEREFTRARLVRNATNLGFTRACNQGVELARGDLVLLLNSDVELENDALHRMVEFLLRHPQHAAVAPRLLHANGATQRACMRFPRMATALFFGTPLERWWPDSRELRRYFTRDVDPDVDADVEQPPGACMLLRADTLRALGGLDESMWLYFSDVDLSLRLARAGWRTRYLASARAVHHTGSSTRMHGERLLHYHRDRLCYYRKHFGVAGGAWLKACVLFAALDYCTRQAIDRARERRAEPLVPVLRSLGSFLAS
jgi:N-acetylglucosaminyl-diphospho-decaprenol L-rhamnosyltransferase